MNLKLINKRVIESLIKVGTFDSCESFNRKTLLENMETIIAFAQKVQADKELGQTNLFDMDSENQSTSTMLEISEVSDFDESEKLKYESQLMGIYVSGHPLDKYGDIMTQLASREIATIQEMTGSNKREMVLAGLITDKKNILTKKGDKMCFATLEDLTGKIECIIFPKTFAEYCEVLEGDDPLVMTGNVNLAEDPRKFFPHKIQLLKDQAEEKVTAVRINVKIDELSSYRLKRFKQVLLSYRGVVPTQVIFENDFGRARLKLGETFLVNPSPQLAAKVNEVFDRNSVKFIVDGKLQEVQVQ